MAENHSVPSIETNRIFYTDQDGFYDIYIDNSDSVYYMKMTHDKYIYPIPQPQIGYPQIAYADIQLEDELYNFIMIKKGKVKIEGQVMCDYCDTFFVSSVKISILRRLIGNTNYPDAIGINTFTNNKGYYYIEYDGGEEYEYFLKPEKDGYYYYDKYGTVNDCVIGENIDPGYIIPRSFRIQQIE
ncbi:MAG: hypothetical protein JXR68_12015 [Bacteroidales bacterium]|nr:hypothetical protein [Bacteroidales bacterium]